jgi:hypothetical protein
LAVPSVKITNLKWSAQEARRGDIVTMSAEVKGASEGCDGKIVIYEYDADGAHDRITELPVKVQKDKIELKWAYEYHEDTDEIPTTEELKKYGKNYNPPEYFFTVDIGGVTAGKKQESKLLTFKDWVDVHLTDGLGRAIANEDYILHLPDGTTRKGKLSADGRAREADVPPGKYRFEFPNLQGKFQDTGGPA